MQVCDLSVIRDSGAVISHLKLLSINCSRLGSQPLTCQMWVCHQVPIKFRAVWLYYDGVKKNDYCSGSRLPYKMVLRNHSSQGSVFPSWNMLIRDDPKSSLTVSADEVWWCQCVRSGGLQEPPVTVWKLLEHCIGGLRVRLWMNANCAAFPLKTKARC